MLKKLLFLILTALLAMLSLSGCGVGSMVILGIVIGNEDLGVKEALELKEEDHISFNQGKKRCGKGRPSRGNSTSRCVEAKGRSSYLAIQ